ncbi:MAG: HypC/HybG/HupF family hydrogenase formation chaperone [Acidobacteriota bacterium]|nr:HypC/HybG/HupF family hydrogenase formation chaperone [Acidobacteriota bacterium]
MCLGVPGEIIDIDQSDSLTRMGKVRFGGIRKDISLALVPEASAGDYVIVHAGFAISRLDQAEAAAVLETLEQLEQPL